MAAAGCKRHIFCPVPIKCQFTASSIQHVSGRLRTQALRQMLAEGQPSFCKIKKCIFEPNPATKNEYPRLLVPICWPMNFEGSLSSMVPVLVTRGYHHLDSSPATGRYLTTSCETFTTFGVALATNGTS